MLLAAGHNLGITMKQARHAQGSARVHLRYGQLTLTDVKKAVEGASGAKGGLSPEAAKEMSAVTLRKSIRITEAELAERGLHCS